MRSGFHEMLTPAIAELAARLVAISSQPDEDFCPIASALFEWLNRRKLPAQLLRDSNDRVVGVFIHLAGSRPGPSLCLNACLDTAPIGLEDAWRHPPLGAVVDQGRLYGRGAADSKIGVAMLSLLAEEAMRIPLVLKGDLYFLFDGDEHSGQFGGVRAFLEQAPKRPEGWILAYPGNDVLNIGARGFLRGTIVVHGESAHTGSRHSCGKNAIGAMASLINDLATRLLPVESDPDFSFGPKCTITRIEGGSGYTQVPDCCQVDFDFRLTPQVDAPTAIAWLKGVIGDRAEIAVKNTLPAYKISDQSWVAQTLRAAAEGELKRHLPNEVCGPSNAGNYLATFGIPTVSGFGVSGGGIHGVDEYVDLSTVAPVWRTYRRVVEILFGVK